MGPIQGFIFNPTDDTIAVWGAMRGLALFTTDSQALVRVIDTGKARCMSAAWTPDGRDIAVGTEGGVESIVIYRVDTGEPMQAMNQRGAIIVGLGFSHHGRFLISGG